MIKLLCLVLGLQLVLPYAELFAQRTQGFRTGLHFFQQAPFTSNSSKNENGISAKVTGSSFPNIQVTNDSGKFIQSETTISIHPVNPDIIVGGSNNHPADTSYWSKVGFVRSADGGRTWEHKIMPHQVQDKTMQNGVDPTLAFDADGNLYYSYLLWDSLSTAIVVDKSSNAGRIWSNSYIVQQSSDSNLADKPILTCDISNSPFRNNVYIVWSNKNPSTGVHFSQLKPGDSTFSSLVRISKSVTTFPGGIVVGPDGIIYITWSIGFYARDIEIIKSTDGGETFSDQKHVAFVLNTTVWNLLKGNVRTHSMPSIAVDHSSAPQNGNVYIVWDDQRNGDSDILFTRSIDQGETWSTPQRINDDSLKNGKDQFLPSITVDSTGKITVIFYDSRNDPDNILTDVYAAQSIDEGKTWVNFKVSDTSFDPRLVVYRGYQYGDYMWVTSTANISYPLWWDARSGNSELYTAMIDNRPTQNLIGYELLNKNQVSAGDTVHLAVSIKNHFSSVAGLKVTLSAKDPNITFQKNTTSFGAVDSMKTAVNLSNPFIFTVASNAPPHTVTFGATIESQSAFGILSFTESFSLPITSVTAVIEEVVTLPDRIQLSQNFPNPFNPSTRIKFKLPEKTYVTLKVFNVFGQEISTLVKRELEAGDHSVTFEGSGLPSGTYFYRMKARNFLQVKKMILAR